MKTNNEVILECLGAAQTVTGSKHLLRTPELTILVDCGLFQGLKELRLKNWETLPINPAEIDVVLLTHAHLDHCGYLPMLVKNGYKGPIWMTPPTAELTKIILSDSGKIQEEDADRANRYKFSKHKPALPLYTLKEAEAVFEQFITLDEGVVKKLSTNVQFQYHKNGHILGSCYIEMDCFGKKIVFSGDIGRYNSEVLASPSHKGKADFVIMESTYGDRLHGPMHPREQLSQIAYDTYSAHGNVLIPCFAVGRSQEIMFYLDTLKNTNKLPAMPIYLDSPMAANVTDLLHSFPQWHLLSKEQCTSMMKDITINRDSHNTENIIKDKHSKIVLSASGMLEGGRVLQYLQAYAPKEDNAILLIGYQAEGTRGRTIKEGGHEVKLYGKYVPIKAHVEEITGLSAHGDQTELLQWVKDFETPPGKIFLVHGEPAVQAVFQLKIKDELKIETLIPKQYESFVLFNTTTQA